VAEQPEQAALVRLAILQREPRGAAAPQVVRTGAAAATLVVLAQPFPQEELARQVARPQKALTAFVATVVRTSSLELESKQELASGRAGELRGAVRRQPVLWLQAVRQLDVLRIQEWPKRPERPLQRVGASAQKLRAET